MSTNLLPFLGAIGVAMLLSYLVAVLAVGRFLTHYDMFLPRSAPDGRTELQGYRYQDVEFVASDGVTLRGWFIESEGNRSGATLFLVPGWTRTRSRYLPQIKFLVDSGYHVFTYDQRSHGTSDTGRITYGPREGCDLLAAVEHSKALASVDPGRLGAVGFSLGAAAVIYAARTRVFRAVVLEGVFGSSYDMGEAILRRRFGPSLTKILGYAVFWVGAKLWTLGKFRHSSPADHIGFVSPTPTMIIRGTHDHQVPVASADKVMRSAGQPVEVWIHEAGHTQAYDAYPAEYAERVLQFLEAHLS